MKIWSEAILSVEEMRYKKYGCIKESDKTDNVDSIKAIIKIQEQEKNNNQMTTKDCTVKIIFQTLRISIL